MRYYFRENVRRYEKMTQMGVDSWAEWAYGGTDYNDFSSRAFLEFALPKLRFRTSYPRALELGTGVGPGALMLAELGFRVTGYDVIPTAIETARKIATDRDLEITYEVMDVTQIPHDGESFDLIVDSYCINHIVFVEERTRVFESVKARLKPAGYYLVSSAVYNPERHSPDEKIVDASTGRTYDLYDGDCLYDPETDYLFEPFGLNPSEYERNEPCTDKLIVNRESYIPLRCYRNRERLEAELKAHGFDTLLYHGEYEESLLCVHEGSGTQLAP